MTMNKKDFLKMGTIEKTKLIDPLFSKAMTKVKNQTELARALDAKPAEITGLKHGFSSYPLYCKILKFLDLDSKEETFCWTREEFKNLAPEDRRVYCFEAVKELVSEFGSQMAVAQRLGTYQSKVSAAGKGVCSYSFYCDLVRLIHE